jgi:hypothetical protein
MSRVEGCPVHLLCQSDKFLIFILMLIAFSLRWYHVGFHDIWYDEAISYNHAIDNFSRFYLVDYQLPLYYAMLKLWVFIFGSASAASRGLSVLLNVLTVPFLFKLTRLLADRKIALYTVLIFILSPFQIWYAQEARSYALIVFETVCFFYFLLKYEGSRERRYFYAALIAVTLVSCTHYCLIVFVFFLIFVHFKKISRGLVTACFLLVAAIFILIQPLLSAEFKYFSSIKFWAPKPLWISPLITFNNFLFSYNRQPFFNILTLIFTAGVLVLIFFSREKNSNLRFLKIVVFVPVFACFMLSKLCVSFYIDRLFIFTSPFFYILTALSLSGIKNKLLQRTLSTAFVMMLCVAAVFYYTGINEQKPSYPLSSFWYRMHQGVPFKYPVKSILNFLDKSAQPNDSMFLSGLDFRMPFYHYLRYDKSYKNLRKLQTDFLVVSYTLEHDNFESRILKMLLQTKRARIIDAQAVLEVPQKSFRYWLLTSNWNRGIPLSPQSNGGLVREYMRKNFTLVRTVAIDGIIVDLFENKKGFPAQ